MAGTLTIHSNGTGKLLSGHSWIEYVPEGGRPRPMVHGATILLGQSYLRIRGLVFHSNYAVGDIKIERRNGTVLVLVDLVLTKKGLSGSFAKDIPLQEGDRKVLYGPAASRSGRLTSDPDGLLASIEYRLGAGRHVVRRVH